MKTGSRWAADFQRLFDAEALDPHSGYTRPDCNGSLMSVAVGGDFPTSGNVFTRVGSLFERVGAAVSAQYLV